MTAMPLPPPGDNRLGAIADDLALKGWSWQPGFLPDALYRALREDVLAIDAEDELELAGVGRDDAFQLDRSIRRACRRASKRATNPCSTAPIPASP